MASIAHGGHLVDADADEGVGRLHVDDFGGAGLADGADAANHQNAGLVDVKRRIVDAFVLVFGTFKDDGASSEGIFGAGFGEIALAELFADHRGLDEGGIEEIATYY